MLHSLDTETTGLDIRHGCKPFMVTSCSEEGDLYYWEWEVDPLTRTPILPDDGELWSACGRQELHSFLRNNHFVFHNTKFDFLALRSIGIQPPDFELTQDTLVAAHVLDSAQVSSRGLKDLALAYCDIPDTDETLLHDAVVVARRYAKKHGWRSANEGDPHFPAAKDGWVKMDMWLPAAMAKHSKLKPDHPYWTLCRQYALRDAERTMALWLVLRDGLESENLLDQYELRRQALQVTFEMEDNGITCSATGSQVAKKDYRFKANKAEATCRRIDPQVTNLDSHVQIKRTLFEKFKIEPPKLTKKGNPSTDKDVIDELVQTLVGEPLDFITNLKDFRGYTTALDYLNSYKNFGVELKDTEFWRLYPYFNITGTATTRFSCVNPNAQNISKKERTNLRKVFGPAPGREWFSLDYSNIEMRIFAYGCGDQKLIQAFETGQSVHLIFSEVLFPKEMAECKRKGTDFKEVYESTLYQWTKNGNFSLIYGAGPTKANRTYHVENAYHIIRERLPMIDQFMKEKDYEARHIGYVVTLGGYRLQVPEKKPHAAVNYYVQGSAGWYMLLALLRVQAYLKTLGPEYKMIITVHDELDFDFPLHPDPYHNLRIIYNIKQLMDQSGADLGVPVPAEVERHPVNWATSIKIKDFSCLAI